MRKTTESAQNYIETIYILTRRQKDVHAADVCAYLGFSRPTVSEAVHQLKEKGYLHVDESNHLRLTEEGLSLAQALYERHSVLTQALMSLGVDEKTADEDACKIEHDLSQTSFEKIKEHLLRYKNK